MERGGRYFEGNPDAGIDNQIAAETENNDELKRLRAEIEAAKPEQV